MRKIQRILAISLLILTLVSILSGCVQLPRDEIEVRVVTAEQTYDRDENVTELFFLFDVLNGKARTIRAMEIDVAITFNDGSVKNYTLNYDEPIQYRANLPAIVRATVDGRVESIEVLAYRYDIMNYWDTFGSHIIWTLVFYIVIAVVMVMLAMADMDTLLSIIAGLLVIVCVFCVIFTPLVASIYVIIGTVIAFLPFGIFKLMDYYN